jgi:hypothetical protein
MALYFTPQLSRGQVLPELLTSCQNSSIIHLNDSQMPSTEPLPTLTVPTLWRSNSQHQRLTHPRSPQLATKPMLMTLLPGIAQKDTCLNYSMAQLTGDPPSNAQSRLQVQKPSYLPYLTQLKNFFGGNAFSIALQLDLGYELTIQCDNRQTIRLITAQYPYITTKLKHIIVLHHWLQQEASQGNIHIQWVPTTKMAADGLTKALPRQKHDTFVKQLGLIDISNLIQAHNKT